MNAKPTLSLRVLRRDGDVLDVLVEVERSFNFGFAGRNDELARAHVKELEELGLPAPARIPAIFPIPQDRVVASRGVVVPGSDSYGEVEFALVHAGEVGWLVCAAADHSDFLIEGMSTTRAKTVYEDVLSPEAWILGEMLDAWDATEMTCERRVGADWEVVQRGLVNELLSPQDLIATLEARSGTASGAGTIILSGTIAGEIKPAADAWRCVLRSPEFSEPLVAHYEVTALPAEI